MHFDMFAANLGSPDELVREVLADSASHGGRPGARTTVPAGALERLRRLDKASWWLYSSAAGRLGFRAMQALGLHITPNHFYSPVPDTRLINRQLFNRPSEMPGIDFREREQLRLLELLANTYKGEYSRLPKGRKDVASGAFYLQNNLFSSVDAEILYAMVRHLKPKRIVEIGSGYSTLLMLQATAANQEEGKPAQVRCIDPYPRNFIAELADRGRLDLSQASVETVPLDTFSELSPRRHPVHRLQSCPEDRW